jgi:endonuclease-3
MARKTTPKKAKKSGKPKASQPKPWTPAEVEEAFRRFKKASPAPQTELEHINN